MNVAVLYQSRSGNTKKVAEAIADAVGTRAIPVGDPLPEAVDLLFVGGGIYASNIDERLREALGGLTRERVGAIAVFETSLMPGNLPALVSQIVDGKGIAVRERHFRCAGRFLLFQLGRPNARDLLDAAAFAREIMQEEAGNA